MERKEKSQALETSNTFLDKQQSLLADGPSESPAGRPQCYADDLIFDPDKFVLSSMSEPYSNNSPPSVEAAPLANQPSIPEFLKRVLNAAILFCVGGLFAAVLVGAVSFWYQSSYEVEAKVLFLGGDHKVKGLETWSIGDELRTLSCPEVASSAAQEVLMAFPDASGNGKGVQLQQVSWGAGNANSAATMMPAMSESNGLALWRRNELSVEPVESNGATGFRLKMRGPDADLLKGALSAYIRRYLEYRNTLVTCSSTEIRQAAGEPESTCDTNEALSLDSQLRKLELLRRSFELALQSMDNGKGTFKGFIPDVSIAATPSLARFQDKLLELEIKKRGLAVQYTQNSKEIRSIDQEIRGVKGAMRECLSEYVEFLKQGKKGLVSQKAGQEQRKGSKESVEKQASRNSSGQLPNGDAWYRTRDGLYVFTSGPYVVSEPALARLGQCTRSFLARGSGRPLTPAVGTVACTRAAGEARFALAEKALSGPEDCGPRLATSELSSKDKRNIQQEQNR
jgi:hypothetical protein